MSSFKSGGKRMVVKRRRGGDLAAHGKACPKCYKPMRVSKFGEFACESRGCAIVASKRLGSANSASS